MLSPDFRLSHRTRRADEEPKLLRYHTWGMIASTAIGAGVSLYGANKQAKDNAHAMDLNQQQQAAVNNQAWVNYLLSRGIAPTGPIATGVIPTSGQSRAVNTRLPLWATMRTPGGSTVQPRRILGVSPAQGPGATPSAPAPEAPKPQKVFQDRVPVN